MIENELEELRKRSLEVNNDLFFKLGRKVSIDEMQAACRCMNAISIAIDSDILGPAGWSLNREALISTRASLPTFSNQRLAKMIGDLIDDVVDYMDARENNVTMSIF